MSGIFLGRYGIVAESPAVCISIGCLIGEFNRVACQGAGWLESKGSRGFRTFAAGAEKKTKRRKDEERGDFHFKRLDKINCVSGFSLIRDKL